MITTKTGAHRIKREYIYILAREKLIFFKNILSLKCKTLLLSKQHNRVAVRVIFSGKHAFSGAVAGGGTTAPELKLAPISKVTTHLDILFAFELKYELGFRRKTIERSGSRKKIFRKYSQIYSSPLSVEFGSSRFTSQTISKRHKAWTNVYTLTSSDQSRSGDILLFFESENFKYICCYAFLLLRSGWIWCLRRWIRNSMLFLSPKFLILLETVWFKIRVDAVVWIRSFLVMN